MCWCSSRSLIDAENMLVRILENAVLCHNIHCPLVSICSGFEPGYTSTRNDTNLALTPLIHSSVHRSSGIAECSRLSTLKAYTAHLFSLFILSGSLHQAHCSIRIPSPSSSMPVPVPSALPTTNWLAPRSSYGPHSGAPSIANVLGSPDTTKLAQ